MKYDKKSIEFLLKRRGILKERGAAANWKRTKKKYWQAVIKAQLRLESRFFPNDFGTPFFILSYNLSIEMAEDFFYCSSFRSQSTTRNHHHHLCLSYLVLNQRSARIETSSSCPFDINIERQWSSIPFAL